jgi:hypothetical protein
MPKPSPKKPDIEFEPDAWARFETLVKSAAKMGPMPHRATKKKAKPTKAKK